MLNPLRSEAEAFRLLLYAIAVIVVVIAVLIVIARDPASRLASSCRRARAGRGQRACDAGSASREAAGTPDGSRVVVPRARISRGRAEPSWPAPPCGAVPDRHGRYLTVSVPYIPAWRWPGASQKNV